MILREYQIRAIQDLRDRYAAGYRKPCLVLPTGGGKTLVASEIIRLTLQRSKRAVFLAHRTELLDQTVAKLERFGITDVRLIQAARDSGNPLAPVAVASVQTLTKWQDRLPLADLVVFDECHHTVAKTWATLADRYASAALLGLTATPERGDGRPLGDVFDCLVVGSTVRELTELGHLVPCRVFAPPVTLDTAELALSPVESYQRHGGNGRAVVFCVTVEHAQRVAAEFSAAGYAAGVVSGQMRGRADTLKRFASGELRIVANVHVLTEGWDDPGCSVAILARKPEHAGTMLQMIGRVLRPAPGKQHCTVIDLCGSVLEHGTPEMDREYSLTGDAIRSASRQPIRQCPSCGAVFPSTGSPACPTCGAILPVRPQELPRSTGVGLEEVSGVAPRAPWTVVMEAKFPGRCATCAGGIAVGERIAWVKGEKPKHVACAVRRAA